MSFAGSTLRHLVWSSIPYRSDHVDSPAHPGYPPNADFDAASNAPGLRNQIERFAVGMLDDVYCAGTTPLP